MCRISLIRSRQSLIIIASRASSLIQTTISGADGDFVAGVAECSINAEAEILIAATALPSSGRFAQVTHAHANRLTGNENLETRYTGNLDLPRNLEDFIAKRRAAVVLWDLQNGLAGKASNSEEVRQNALRLIEAADNAGLPVIWSRHILPPLEYTTGPFLLFLMKKQKVDDPALLKPTMQPGMPDTDFLEGLKPAAHHIVIEKSQPSLFVDTPLDLRLKTLRVETLVFAGVATDIGIEFNARHAAACGYYPVVAEDACGAYSREAHERSLTFLRSWITPIVTTREICNVWANHSNV